MGRPFQEKYADVQWEPDEEGYHLQAWKDGHTGVPIVDAAMRQAREMGWMHNRGRMIAAMYLVKDLMIDWRLGEKVRQPGYPMPSIHSRWDNSTSWRCS